MENEVDTNPTPEVLLAKLAELQELLVASNQGKSIDLIKIQVEESKRRDAEKAAALKLKADIAGAFITALEVAKLLKVPRSISQVLVKVSKDGAGAFTSNPNRATVWADDVVRALNSRELMLIANSVGKGAVEDFLRDFYASAFNGGLDRANFSLDRFNPILAECAKVVIVTATPITVTFEFTWREIATTLASGDQSVDYLPEWTFTSSLDKAEKTTKTNGNSGTRGKSDKAPNGAHNWYEYLQDRRNAGDPEIAEWYATGNPSNIPNNHKYYFQKWLDRSVPGAFVAWVRKDQPGWNPARD